MTLYFFIKASFEMKGKSKKIKMSVLLVQKLRKIRPERRNHFSSAPARGFRVRRNFKREDFKMDATEKKSWECPEVVTFGRIEDLTATDKYLGGADGIVLQPGNNPLGNLS